LTGFLIYPKGIGAFVYLKQFIAFKLYWSMRSKSSERKSQIGARLCGKFIVIDGTDGVGKATQVSLLAGRLSREGCDVGVIDFPQYDTRSAAMIEDYLAGKYGSADEVSPYAASIFYACDRFDASPKIREALREGRTIISNRYTASNMGHQGGKIRDPAERRRYWEWLLDLEFAKMKIPKPDITLILDVSAEIGAVLAQKRSRQEFLLKPKKQDIHEADIEHLRQSAAAYLELAELWPDDFALVRCTENGAIVSSEQAHERIWQTLVERLQL
jgi:dTMP kinase